MACDGVTLGQMCAQDSGLVQVVPDPTDLPRNYDAVRAISFDLDDTLWDFRLAVLRAEEKLRVWLADAVPGTVHVLHSVLELQGYRQRMALSRPDLLRLPHLVRLESIRQVLLDANGDPNLASEAYAVFYRARQCAAVFDDVVPALDWLSAHYPLVAVTNGNSDLRASPLGPYFCKVLTAAKLGFGKPDPRIFQAAADAAGVPIGTVLHVGDDMALDVEGALAAGMQAVWMDRTHLPRSAQETSASVRSFLCISDLSELCAELGAWPTTCSDEAQLEAST